MPSHVNNTTNRNSPGVSNIKKLKCANVKTATNLVNKYNRFCQDFLINQFPINRRG